MLTDHYGVMARADAPVELSDDLDEIAERYIRDRAALDPVRAGRLRDDVIRRLLPFAGRLAGRYRHSRESMDDLEQVARLALVKAIDRYDPERGSFTAYAVTTISGELKRYFRDHTWGVQVPRRLQDLSRVAGRATEELTAELHRPPTEQELAARCGAGVAEVAEALASRAGYRPVSLSLPVGDSGAALGDLLGDADGNLELVTDQLTLRRLIERLPAREKRILLERFYGNRSQSEIADDLGISQMHVSRLISRVLGWLRTAMLTDETPLWPGDTADPAQTGPAVAIRRSATGPTRVVVTGEVDRDNAGRLQRKLVRIIARAPAGAQLEVDLGGVPSLSAAGARALLAAYDAGRVRGVVVSVVAMQPFVRRFAAVVGLTPLLPPGEAGQPN
ncbi:hypothetical protein Aab01nite_27150 [Paractinoplanes abujensis]|uniref:RNA polymerase sigma-B factor n=1 Tax=Paractinoplanes abujensis TaxID=882441 RepID=A0A7W7D1S9_9ACTN|nr:sigma-70 family RNA polymerase sigma factor [Actinoplanes abujensis]MBB4698389.1 RNA polymerase sigma-B factor [Actinoplanes abujensis]GID19125.1 hypothetical protein Aab01nite_27150 [Actinoplanes abujensis]